MSMIFDLSASRQHRTLANHVHEARRPKRPAIVCRLKPEGMAARGNPCGFAGCGAPTSARYGWWWCVEHGHVIEEA